MILLDTNVLVAAAIEADDLHAQAVTLLTELDSPDEEFLVPPTVVADCCYLIDRAGGPPAEAAFLRSFVEGDLQLVDLTVDDLSRMADLVDQYAELRLGGTDASIGAVAERLNITKVATFDRRDFAVVRPCHVATFELLAL